MMLLDNLCKKTTVYLLFIFIIFLFSKSLGAIDRWDLLQQIAMSDNFLISGSFYPDSDDPSSSDVSVYFPGVALLAVLLTKIGFSSNLVEIMLCIASITILFFFLVQYKLATHFFGKKITPQKFVPIIVITSFSFFPTWFSYAVEFKPDIIALTIGLACVHLVLHREVKATYIQIIFGGLVAGSAIIFKQQYLAFIIGLSFHAFVFPTKKRLLFSASSLISMIAIIIVIYIDENAWFWSIEVLKDDGIKSFSAILFDHYNLTLTILTFLVLYFGYIRLANGYFCLEGLAPKLNYKNLVSSPWGWGVFFSILAALASALKIGGNSGNTELGLVLLLPLFAFFLSYVKQWVLMGIALISVYSFIPAVYFSIKNYNDARELIEFVESDALPDNTSIASGSDVYFAARRYTSSNRIAAYWPIALKEKAHPRNVIDALIQSKKPVILITDSFVDSADIANRHNYKIVFTNAIGSVLIE